MFPPLPQEIARHYCLELVSELESGSGAATLRQVAKESQERLGQGLMVGALVCTVPVEKPMAGGTVAADSAGLAYDVADGAEAVASDSSERLCSRLVIYAVSGNAKILERKSATTSDGLPAFIAPSIVPIEKITQALAKNDKEIHELTDLIKSVGRVDRTRVSRVGTGCRIEGYRDQPSPQVSIQADALLDQQLSDLKARRRALTDESLAEVFNLYSFTRFDGATVSLNQIIKSHGGHLPPTGTGDCCAPKLLSYAFSHGLHPISMDEVFYQPHTSQGLLEANALFDKRECDANGLYEQQRATVGRVDRTRVSRVGTGCRIEGYRDQSFPPCDERCGYILPEILGIEILYRDSDIIVINKQAGLLSVPGRGEEKADCAEARARRLFSQMPAQPAVHRLDMETSGILILARNKEAHKRLNRQFEEALVHKKYVALLDGVLRGYPSGHLELPFRLDTENRPHQIYDEENGKVGITDWKKLGVEKWQNPESGEVKKVTRIEFSPQTGRTHQLRLAASDPHGLGIPILGDSLYGEKKEGERLMLHAFEITFFHPITGEKMEFVCKSPF